MRARFFALFFLLFLPTTWGCDDDNSFSGPEICDNKRDDNGDGRVDCEDEQCSPELVCAPAHWREGLEEGVNYGLALDYPNDEGIEAHPHVLAAESFESGSVTIPTQEDRYKNSVVVTDATAYTGSYSSEMAWSEGERGPTTRFTIPDSAHQGERSTYFVRLCFNYDSSFHPGPDRIESGVGVKGFGVVAESETEPTGLDHPPNGRNWYNAQVQFVGWGPSQKPQANDGYLWVGHLYSYNPAPTRAKAALGELKSTDPAVGDTPYRFSSYADPFFFLDYNAWHCYEVGMYLNTPGRHDGEARFWIDGVLQSRVTHIRYRDLGSLMPNEMHLNLHRTTEEFPHTMYRWTDNIVLATRYIGPVVRP